MGWMRTEETHLFRDKSPQRGFCTSGTRIRGRILNDNKFRTPEFRGRMLGSKFLLLFSAKKASEGNITRVVRNLAFARKKRCHFRAFSAYFPVFGAKKGREKTRAQPWYARKSGKSPGQKAPRKIHPQKIHLPKFTSKNSTQKWGRQKNTLHFYRIMWLTDVVPVPDSYPPRFSCDAFPHVVHLIALGSTNNV